MTTRLVLLGMAAIVSLVPSATVAGLVDGDASKNPSRRLRAIFAEYWDDELRAEPLEATFVGDHRHDDRLADPSDAAFRARVERERGQMEALRAIDPALLAADERIDREVLIAILDDRLEGDRFRGRLIPVTQQEGLHLKFAQSVNFHPAGAIGDLENYVRRLRDFSKAVDATIAVMRLGIAERRVPPRITMAKVVPQLRALATPEPEQSPLWGIVKRLPKDWSEGDAERAKHQVREAIAASVSPSFGRFADFVEREYLPACRESIGLWDSPDGDVHYAYRARSMTTTRLTPDEIHEIGLVEMAKIRRAMEEVRQRVGFRGDLEAFMADLRTNPRFKNTSSEGIFAGYRTILEAIDAKLPDLFGRLPRTDYGLREIEAYRAKSAAAGYYYPAPEDGSRPGFFYVNTSEPESRTTYTMQALAYHEAVPGHHLQFALAMEVPGRPAFRRFGYFSSFSEGWGLYSEALPREVGLYADPYAEMGQLEYSAWRAGRLVVDTGMHHRKWTRDRAVAYLEANTAVPRIEIESEVDRYIAWPGQALAYKIGELKIREIRARAERRLGAKFDVRAFHDRLLSLGSVPLGVLERFMEPEATGP